MSVYLWLLLLAAAVTGGWASDLPPDAPGPGPYTITDLGTLGRPHSMGHAINSRGEVVGIVSDADSGGMEYALTGHAFLWANGKMRDLGTLRGCAHSSAVSINNKGQVVGVAVRKGNGAYRAFLWADGKMRDLGALPGDRMAGAAHIDDQGQVVGASIGSEERSRAFLWRDGKMTELPGLHGGRTGAICINRKGDVVGTSRGAESLPKEHLVLWMGGKLHDLGVQGGASSTPFAINDQGQIVGSSFLDRMEVGTIAIHAFLYSDGAFKDIDGFGAGYSEARAINSRGQVVGKAFTQETIRRGDDTPRAFLYQAGKMRDLNDLLPKGSGWVLREASGINDAGQIAGTGRIRDHDHAFLLTPARAAGQGRGMRSGRRGLKAGKERGE